MSNDRTYKLKPLDNWHTWGALRATKFRSLSLVGGAEITKVDSCDRYSVLVWVGGYFSALLNPPTYSASGHADTVEEAKELANELYREGMEGVLDEQ